MPSVDCGRSLDRSAKLAKHRCVLVLPYFGVLPEYFPLFLRSVEFNPQFDLLLVTDCDVRGLEIPPNVRVIQGTFDEIKNRICNTVGRKVCLASPYKLCDYRPLFGLVFEEELCDYDFWGHCDADMLWGDLGAFITPEHLDMYDKLLVHGHFSLCRNVADVNEVPLRYGDVACGLHMALGTDQTCYFDEVGMQLVAQIAGMRVWRNPTFADILPSRYKLQLAPICDYKNQNGQRFFWEDGHVWRYVPATQTVDEFMYIHMQKRRMHMCVDPTGDACWEIRPNGFFVPEFPAESLSQVVFHAVRQTVGYQWSRIRRISPQRVSISTQVKRLRDSMDAMGEGR